MRRRACQQGLSKTRIWYNEEVSFTLIGKVEISRQVVREKGKGEKETCLDTYEMRSEG